MSEEETPPDPLVELQRRYTGVLAVNHEQVDRLTRAQVEVEHLRTSLKRCEAVSKPLADELAAAKAQRDEAQAKVKALEERCKLLESHIPARLTVPGASK